MGYWEWKLPWHNINYETNGIEVHIKPRENPTVDKVVVCQTSEIFYQDVEETSLKILLR